MRFTLQSTSDGSLTVFDREVGECFKSQHAARTEAAHVFYKPGVLENPWYSKAKPFRILELGLGLGTNFLYCLEQNFQGEFLSIERDLKGLNFYLTQEPNSALSILAHDRSYVKEGFRAQLICEDFQTALPNLAKTGFLAHAIFFDPFSPKNNPECWTEEFFRIAASLLSPDGRLVTYSVSRSAKDAATAAGLVVEKRKLMPSLKKRSSLLALKPNS